MSDLEKPKKKKANSQPAETYEHPLEKVLKNVQLAAAELDFLESEEAPAQDHTVAAPASDEEIEDFSADASPVQDDAEGSIEMKEISEAATDASLTNEFLPESDWQEQEQAMLLTDFSASEAEEAEVPQEIEFIDHKQMLSIIESLLFSTDRPVGLGTLKAVFQGTQIKTGDIKKALDELQVIYADAARGVCLEEINGGWQLRTKVDNMEFLRRLAKSRPFKLSGPALEVLSIVAYKQPIVKSEVDEIRGVESGHLIRALMEKHLVCFQGKSELPGKPMQYGTTRKFLEIFGLRNLRELPSLDEIDQLLPEGIGEEVEDEKLSDVTDKMSTDFQGNYSAGEEELEKIEETLGAIDTSSEFFEEEKRRQRDKRDRERAQDLREALDVGELVDEKDRRWLERYEQSLLQAAAEAAAREADGMQLQEQPITENHGPAEAMDALGEEVATHPLALLIKNDQMADENDEGESSPNLKPESEDSED